MATVGRDAREVHLESRRNDDPGHAVQRVGLEFGDPPVVIAVTLRRRGDEPPAVGRPVVFVNEGPVGRNKLQLTAGRADSRDPLEVFTLADFPDLARTRLERATLLVGARRGQHGDRAAIRRPARRRNQTFQLDNPARDKATFLCWIGSVECGNAISAASKYKLSAIRRPCHAGIFTLRAGVQPSPDRTVTTPDDHRSVLFGSRVRLANGLDGRDLLPISIQCYRGILMEHTKVRGGRDSQGERG